MLFSSVVLIRVKVPVTKAPPPCDALLDRNEEALMVTSLLTTIPPPRPTVWLTVLRSNVLVRTVVDPRANSPPPPLIALLLTILVTESRSVPATFAPPPSAVAVLLMTSACSSVNGAVANNPPPSLPALFCLN